MSLEEGAYLIFFFARDTAAYVAHRLLSPNMSYTSVKHFYTENKKKIKDYNEKNPVTFSDSEDVTFIMDSNIEVESTGEEDNPVEMDETFFGKKMQRKQKQKREKV